MIITKSEPFTKGEIEKVKEVFDVYIKTVIDFNSFINIRPNDSNTTNQIQNPKTREIYEDLTKFFFKMLYEWYL